MSADTESKMVALSDEDGSGLDLNLSLHSKKSSPLSNGLHLGPNRPPAISNDREGNKELHILPPPGEFEDGGSSQNSSLSMINRKRNHPEGLDQRRCGSDEEEGEHSRKKLRLSWDQTLVLEETFKRRPTLNSTQKESLAKELGIQTRQVEVWFQNRRARIKVKQTEAEAEYMKQNCLSLMEHVRRLQKEVNELRAQKLASQFYMQIPSATTLTLCPSCERVGIPATTSGAGNASRDGDLGRVGLGSTDQKNHGSF